MTFEAPRDLRRPRHARPRAGRDRRLRRHAAARHRATGRTSRPSRDVARRRRLRRRPTRRRTTGARYDAARRRRRGARHHGPAHAHRPGAAWATNGAKDNVTRPSPKEFQAFATAVGAPLRRPGRAVVDLERAQPAAVPAAAVSSQAHGRVAAHLPQASSSPASAACARRQRRATPLLFGETVAARHRQASSRRWRSCAGRCA